MTASNVIPFTGPRMLTAGSLEREYFERGRLSEDSLRTLEHAGWSRDYVAGYVACLDFLSQSGVNLRELLTD